MDAQDFRSLQEAYMEVVENQQQLDELSDRIVAKTLKARERKFNRSVDSGAPNKEFHQLRRTEKLVASRNKRTGSNIPVDEDYVSEEQLDEISDRLATAARNTRQRRFDRSVARADTYADAGYQKQKGKTDRLNQTIASRNQRTGSKIKAVEQIDIYDIILSHLLDEGYADTQQAAEAIMVNMSEEWRESIVEKEDSPYEKASDAALDAKYGYGRATGNKHSFGRAANRSSAAAALRAIRRGERSGSGTSTEAGADAVHQGWARTARTSADQTPEKKARRAELADTPYSKLPDDEKEKDRVSFNAVRAVYNNRNR